MILLHNNTWDGEIKSQYKVQIALQENNLHLLSNGISVFSFTTTKNELRTAIGTLLPALLPPKIETVPIEGKAARKIPENTQIYFDLQKLAWRSYNIDSLVCVLVI